MRNLCFWPAAACCLLSCWLSASSIYSLLVPGSILPAARNPISESAPFLVYSIPGILQYTTHQ
jgi:hypothetical protein